MGRSTVKLDGNAVFGNGDHTIKPTSWGRESVQRGFAGLNGVLSIDMGQRERTLEQRGTLSADSLLSLRALQEDITTYIDGQSHELVDQEGLSYSNVLMDSFVLLGQLSLANRVSCEYKIIYTQLSV